MLLAAQEDGGRTFDACLSDQLHDRMMKENHFYASKHEMMEEQIYRSTKQSNTTEMPNVQTIPVVVHIVHDYGAENISDAQVQDAIQHLNDAFANKGYSKYEPIQ